MAHTLTSLHTHVVFSTKERRSSITSALKPDLLLYLGGIVRALHGKAVIINGTADHLHALISLPPTLAVAECLRVMKANSSRWVNEHLGSQVFAWQTGYAAFSVSTSQMPAVVRYIEGQEEHHRKISFRDELRALLRKHGIEFDEKYLWI